MFVYLIDRLDDDGEHQRVTFSSIDDIIQYRYSSSIGPVEQRNYWNKEYYIRYLSANYDPIFISPVQSISRVERKQNTAVKKANDTLIKHCYNERLKSRREKSSRLLENFRKKSYNKVPKQSQRRSVQRKLSKSYR